MSLTAAILFMRNVKYSKVTVWIWVSLSDWVYKYEVWIIKGLVGGDLYLYSVGFIWDNSNGWVNVTFCYYYYYFTEQPLSLAQ